MMKFERNIGKDPASADIRGALERVVASSELGKSPQLVSFLRFVVDAALSGHSRQIKAYTIATDGFGRDARFDPQADPIVRVEAARLRRALEHYYTNGGSNDPVLIELPRGSYVPVFRPNIAPHGAAACLRHWGRQSADALRGNFRLVLLIAAVAATVSLSFDFMWMLLARTTAHSAETTQQSTLPTTSTSISAEALKR